MTDYYLYLQWGIAGLVAIAMLWRGQWTLFHPTAVYLAFHVVVFCVRPTLVRFFDFDTVFRYMRLVPKADDLHLALMLSSAALVMFFVTFTLTTVHALPLQLGPKRELTGADRRAFLITAALFAPLGLYSVFGTEMTGERVGGVYIMTGSTGYATELKHVFIPLSILFMLVARWKWWSYLPFAGYVFYRASQGWGRWTIVLSCFLVVLVWLWDHRKRFPAWRFILPVPFLLILFLNMTHDRLFFWNWIRGYDTGRVTVTDSSRDWRERLDTLDFANYDFLTYIVTYVPRRTQSYTYGTQYLQLFTEPIPRKLWKDKPVGAPVKFFDLNDYGNFIGLTPSLVGDGWMSGGWLGAMLTMGIAGSSLGLAYRWFTRNQEQVHKACAFLIINAMIVQLFRDGGISIFKFLIFALMPLFFWSFLSHRMQLGSEIEAERQALREARERRRAAAAGDDAGLEDADEDESADFDDDEMDDASVDDESDEWLEADATDDDLAATDEPAAEGDSAADEDFPPERPSRRPGDPA